MKIVEGRSNSVVDEIDQFTNREVTLNSNNLEAGDKGKQAAVVESRKHAKNL